MDELVPAFEASLFDVSLENVGADLVKIGIDSILKDSPIKDLPIASLIIDAGKYSQNVNDRNLLKQTLAFIVEFNKNTISTEKIIKYRSKWVVNSKFKEKELGRILIILNRNLDIIKSIFEAKFYSAYIDEQITWNDFCELCEITDRLFVSDIEILERAYRNDGVSEDLGISYKHDRLVSIGLLVNEAQLHGAVVSFELDNTEQQNIMDLTEIGRKFCNIVFRLYV